MIPPSLGSTNPSLHSTPLAQTNLNPRHPDTHPHLSGAMTCALTRCLLMNVPCVLPQSYRNARPSLPRNCSTACSREALGCSRSTSAVGLRPKVRQGLPARGRCSMRVPDFMTSRPYSSLHSRPSQTTQQSVKCSVSTVDRVNGINRGQHSQQLMESTQGQHNSQQQ